MTESKNYHLLLVDDNPVNLELLQELIATHLPQCRTSLAMNGPAALVLAQEQRFDGAFIDMQMPGMDGIDVCRRLKANELTASIPVVLITAHQSTAELRAEGLNAGAYDFISQPIRNIELAARIKVLLRIKDVEEQLLASNQGLRKQVHQKTAALRWMTGLMSAYTGNRQSVTTAELEQLETLLDADAELNNGAFTGELLERFPTSVRRNLALLSLLDEMPLQLAERLTGAETIQGVLDYLERHNFFVNYSADTESYRFENPLKSYLAAQVKVELTAAEEHAVLLQAADWWLEHRSPSQSLDLLMRAGEFNAAERVVQQVGPSLVGHGNIRNMLRWDKEIQQADPQKFPWLHVALAVALQEVDPKRGLDCLQASRTVFAERNDLPGDLFSASHQLKAIPLIDGNLELQIDLLQSTEAIWQQIASACDPHLRIQAALFLALNHIQIGTDYRQVENYLEVVAGTEELEQYPEYSAWNWIVRSFGLFTQGRWRSCFRDLEEFGKLECTADISTTARLSGGLVKAFLLEVFGNELGCRELWSLLRRRTPDKVYQQTILPTLTQIQQVQASVSRGDWHQASGLLEDLSCRPEVRSGTVNRLILEQRAQVLTLADRGDEALAAARQAVEQWGIATSFLALRGRLLLAAVFHALGADNECRQQLRQLESLPGNAEHVLLQLAQWLALQNRPERSDLLQETVTGLLSNLSQHNFENIPFWFPPVHTQLLYNGASVMLERPLLSRLVNNHLHASLVAASQYVPLLDIRVLGEFYLSLDGIEVLRKKDLSNSFRQLLAMLISAPDQQLSQDEVQGQLWPDSSPERSRSKFDSLLLRLRKTLEEIIGAQDVKSYIYLQRGILCLDCCQIDAIRFDTLARQGLRHVRRMEFWQAELAFSQAFVLWHGEMNLGVSLDEKSDFFRQDLLLLYLDAAQNWSELLLTLRRYEQAVEVARQALQYDATHDHLVRLNRRACLGLGRNSQAQQVLHDYATALQSDGHSAADIREILSSIETSGYRSGLNRFSVKC